MNPKSLKCILDIESIIAELELFKSRVDNNFNLFQADFVIKRASERDL
jgi:hypothetical protein